MIIRFLGAIVIATLIVGLICSASTVSTLRNKVSEVTGALEHAKSTIAQLRQEMDEATVPVQAIPIDPPEESPASQADGETTPTIGSDCSFVLRAYENKIGIFTAEGYLIRTLRVDVRTLPAIDRTALESGISVNSRKELDAKIEDFER